MGWSPAFYCSQCHPEPSRCPRRNEMPGAPGECQISANAAVTQGIRTLFMDSIKYLACNSIVHIHASHICTPPCTTNKVDVFWCYSMPHVSDTDMTNVTYGNADIGLRVKPLLRGCLTLGLILIELMSVGSSGSFLSAAWFMVCHGCLLHSRQWRYLLAVADVAWHEQDLGGRESGGDGQTVLLLADLLSMGVDPLLCGKKIGFFDAEPMYNKIKKQKQFPFKIITKILRIF